MGKNYNELYFEFLLSKYKKLLLNKAELAELLGKSETWINRRLANGDFDALPKFLRLGTESESESGAATRLPYSFPIHAVCDFFMSDIDDEIVKEKEKPSLQNIDPENVIEFLKKNYSVETQSELEEKLNLPVGKLSAWKNRSPRKVMELLEEKGLTDLYFESIN